MSPEPTVGVVVPILNEAALLADSMLRWHELGADELVFVDGGSDDGSQQLLRNEGLLCLASEAGRARQMNAGESRIKSDIILFLHIDTSIYSSDLSEIKQVMQDADIVGGRFDVCLSGQHPAFRMIEFFINLRSRLTGISTGDQAQFVRRDVFEKIGGFPEQPLMEDVEFSRLLKKQGKIACLRRKVVTSSRRWEQYGILRTVFLMWKIRFLYWWGCAPDKLAEMYRHAR